ncbi:hypothetical protein KC19_4G134700 [Ceratodon purpureus]|uniref:Peptidoglycan binding-like domain-containing protein n=1 Tax=Ceratodon purpureus TaxID=3225 RepID=A0A8T0I8B4_CERPU|nr:hypothetical protein KC19_4G134700 [Ceratodon purpureus]
MKTPLDVQCNALPMMVVTSGSCCHAPPYRGLSSYEGLRESPRGKGWCINLVKKENLRLASLAGTRISHKNLLKFRYQGSSLCVTGNYSSITSPELCTPFRKTLLVKSSRGRFGKRYQERVERSWVRCHAQGGSRETHEKQILNRSGGAKQSEPTGRVVPLKDTGETSGQGSSTLFYQSQGEVLGGGISNSEYQNIQDLKFSGDMWEGDSGPQVLDLQRALYWFGCLSKRTELTAYFGPETKRALQQFQIAHGVPGTGAWGSSSRQALWKLLSEESSLLSRGESNVYSDLHEPVSTSVDYVNTGGTDVGIRVSELLNDMSAHSQEFMSTLSSAPYWRHVPTIVPRNAALFGLLFGLLVALFGLGYSVVGLFSRQHEQEGQSVRRRVLRASWRDDMSGTSSSKSRRHLDMFPGLDLPAVGEEDFKYRLRSKSKPSSTNGAGRTDRLILYGGQVLVGDETPSHVYPFMSGPASRHGSGKTASQVPPRAKASLITGQADHTSQKLANNGSISRPREPRMSRVERSPKSGGNGWQDKDEENFKNHVEELRKTVQAAEKNREAAMRALAEERQRSLELQVKISRQKEAAAALEEEVRVLKESHDALLASLRKKYSSSVAARAAAALLYQNWDTNYEEGSPQTLSF